METDAAHRYRSRILREMNANRVNPFNSPPSSTGSHGTVSPTMSSVFSDPEGESTRRLNEDIARVTAARPLPVNWEAAHRKWPEYFSKPVARDTNHNHKNTNTRPWSPGAKENKTHTKHADDSTQDAWRGTKARAEMQPRVDNESDMSSILDKSPGRPAYYTNTHKPSPLAKSHARSPSPGHRRSSISEALNRLQRASLSPSGDRNREASPQLSSNKSSLTAVPPSPESVASPRHNASAHVRSFFMPDVSHLGDFVTGTLKFTGSIKNGVPIFVKHGKVHDRQEQHAPTPHAQVDGIKVPEDEDKIFVSMDMIREEIVSLQAAHDKVQEYAERQRQRADTLEAQLQGKGYGNHVARPEMLAHKTQLERDVALLQARLEEASRKLSTNEIAAESLAHERDRAVGRLQDACEDISSLTKKLSVREKELSTSQRQLESTEDLRLDNTALRAENEKLRKEQKRLREEIETLRANRNGRADESLASENKTLRRTNKTLTEENDDLQENVDGLQHELDAVREQLDTLRQETDNLKQEKGMLEEDNTSLVRHNEKYFNDNKNLRRENSNMERSLKELHDENDKMKEEVEFLKQQFDHCRPVPKEQGSVVLGEATDNMTSAYFLQDITVKTSESRPDSDTREPTVDVTNDTEQFARRVSMTRPRSSSKGAANKVAFSIPGKSALKNKANQGSKRRSTEWTEEIEDTTGLQSEDYFSNDQAQISVSVKDPGLTQDFTSQSRASQVVNQQQQQRHAQRRTVEIDTAAAAAAAGKTTASCPALSASARRVLDKLCHHNCQNCIVCSRITSHRGVVTAADATSGKKRVTVPRPVPVTDRNLPEDATQRPSQSPGHALALVIKGLEDEAAHMQMELTTLQNEYYESDKAVARRDRVTLAEGIRTLLKRLEVKNDQIYSLYDVLEGQKGAGQAMSEEEVEMTVLNITGMTVREVTGEFTW